jgi:hypothetical protein
MKQMRLLTIDLLGILGDLLHTASAEPGMSGCYGILLHSARGYTGDEPGQTGLSWLARTWRAGARPASRATPTCF